MTDQSLGKAVLELSTDNAPLNRGMDEAEVKSKEGFGVMERGAETARESMKMLAGALLVGGGVVEGLKAAIEGADQWEKAQESARQAIEHTGADANKLLPEYQAVAKEAANYGMNQAEAMSGLATATTLTGHASAAMRAYKEAVVLAAATHIDLRGALVATSKAQDGMTSSLTRYGVIIPKNASGQEQYTAIMKKFGGQAEANTSELDRLKANAENLGMTLGGPLLKALNLVAAAMITGLDWLQKNKDMVKELAIVVGIGATAFGTYELVTKGIPAAMEAMTAAQEALNGALAANPIGAVIIALTLLVAAFIVAWNHSKTFRDIVDGAFGDVKSAAKDIADFVTQTIPDAFKTVKAWVKDHWPEIATLISGPFAPLVAMATGAFGIRDTLENALGDIKSWLSKTFGGIGGDIAGIVKSPVNAIIGAIDAIELPDGVSIKWGRKFGIPYPDGISVSYGHPFHIPMLAEGGIVTGPTLAMIGEAGPEAVIPLNKGGLQGVTVNVSGVVGNPRDVAVTIGRELQRLQTRGLDFGLA